METDLTRNRLSAVLAGRFRRRLTVVEAGAGFGKTRLLTRAVADNRLAPQGTDVLLRCLPEHADGRILDRAIRSALDGPAPPAEAILAAAPADVALIIDDIHRLDPDGTGAAQMVRLLDELPTNGHLVLSGRSIPVPISRLLATGEGERLSETDMAFTDEELDQFAEAREVDRTALAATGGWPALAEMAARGLRSADFVDEEVLAGLTPELRDVLVRLAPLRDVDPELAERVVGRPVDLEELAATVPLVQRHRTGVEIHELWADHLSSPPEVRRAGYAAAAELAEDRGDHERAFELYLSGEDVDRAAALVRRALNLVDAAVTTSAVRRWADRLPSTSPEGRLAAAVHDLQHDSRTADRLRALSEELASEGESEIEAIALLHLGREAAWRRDLDELDRITRETDRLRAVGVPDGEEGWLLAACQQAQLEGRFDDLVALVDARPAVLERDDYWGDMIRWLRASAAVKLGDIGRTRRLLRDHREKTGALRMNFNSVLIQAAMADGDLEETMRLLESSPGGYRALTATFSRYILATGRLALLAAHGTPAEARAAAELLVRLQREAGATGADHAHALYALRQGDEETAREFTWAMADTLSPAPLDCFQLAFGHAALLRVLAPERSDVHEGAWPPPYDDKIALIDAFARWRHHGEIDALLAVDWRDHRLRGVLPLPWMTEAALVAASGGDVAAAEVLDGLGEAAVPALGRLADGRAATPELAKAARVRLRGLPVPPRRRMEIRLMGPASLLVDDRPVDDPNWRRERVRTLLTHLVVEPETQRDTLARSLWPDSGLDDARNNLKVTMSYLSSMLEPDRKGTAPFFLRTDAGGRITLHRDPMLVVDVWRFDELVVEGFRLDSTGLARQAAETLAEAADLYGGELLGGSVPGLWVELESERLRSAFIRCVGRAGELLVAAGQTERANDLCRRGLLVDEWSESLHRLRAGCFLAQGDRTAARRALERAVAVVAELGVEPEPETEFLARSLGLV